jgi:adenylate kinase
MNILLYGIQGSGKSTQGKLLAQHLHLPYLSTGHIFRDMAKEGSREGRYIKETLAAGLLVPDEITIPIVEKYLAKDEYKRGWILDGFPRTLDQAEKFKTKIDVAFYLLVPDKEALWRLSFRMGSKGEIREDETLMAIRKRIDLFHKSTEPVLDHYRKLDLLVEVNGEKKIEEICEDILGKIRWYQKGNGNKG